MILKPSLLNPLRFIDTDNLNSGFDGDFFQQQLEWYQNPKCYFQPFNISDSLVLQVLADEFPEDFQIVDALTNFVVKNVPWSLSTFVINNPDYLGFNIYEIEYSLDDLGQGKFYGSLGVYTTEAFEVKSKHLNTVLIKYKNSINDYDTVFSTGIEFSFRCQAKVDYDSPKNDRDVYFDQIHNATQLRSVGFRVFKLYLGYSYGLPEWVIDKVNLIQQCDQVTYDNIAYQVSPEAEFDVDKNFDNNWMGANIELQPISNNFIRFTTSNDPEGQTFTPVQKTTPYYNVSSNFSVSSLFKDYSLLEKVMVKKRSVGSFILKLGTSTGNNDIGEFTISDAGSVKTVEWTFTGTSNVYLTIVSATPIDIDVFLVWKQLDELPVPINQDNTPTDNLGKNALMYWSGSESDFNDTWDIATGLGKANTKWSKWCIAGTNGTQVLDGKVLIGIDVTNPSVDYTTLGDNVGNTDNEVTIAKTNLPATPLNVLSSTVAGNGSSIPTSSSPIARARAQSPANPLNYEAVQGSGSVNLGITSNLGEGVKLNITPDGVIALPIIKLVD